MLIIPPSLVECLRCFDGRQSKLDLRSALVRITGDLRVGELEQHLNAALVQELGLKPRQAYGPVRVAVTGRAVSPPLFESLELLGRDRTLARLRAARDR